MASYQNAVVYAIRSHQTDKFYIGSTRMPLHKRFWYHKNHYKHWCNDNTRSYVSSYEIMKYDDVYIELIEECPCENSAQLHKKEGEHIRLYDDTCVNRRIAGRSSQASSKAYKDTHKEELAIKTKAYQIAHRDEILAQKKAYREAHKEEINAKHKAYREAHKEEYNAKQREQRATAKAVKADSP